MALKDSLTDLLLYEDKNNAKNLGNATASKVPTIATSAAVTTPTVANPATNKNTYTSVQSAPVQSTTNNYYDELMAAIDAQTKAKREAQLASLEAQLSKGLSNYDAQINALDPVYQQMRNQSEVERYKAKDALRESLANRGALDSGLGRQEMLNLQSNYGNNLNAINLQYQSEVDALNRAKQALNDEAAAQRIQIESDLENIGLENKIAALKDQIAAQQSTARQAAQSTVSRSQSANNTSGSLANASAVSNVNKLIQKQGGGNVNSIASIIASGYQNGSLNEDDVRTLAAKYGINVR